MSLGDDFSWIKNASHPFRIDSSAGCSRSKKLPAAVLSRDVRFLDSSMSFLVICLWLIEHMTRREYSAKHFLKLFLFSTHSVRFLGDKYSLLLSALRVIRERGGASDS